LNLYRRLSSLKEESELEAMTEEMGDRFGPPPEEVSNLLNVMSVRLMLKRMLISRLDVSEKAVIFTFSSDTPIEPGSLVKVVERQKNRFQFLSEKKLKIRILRGSPMEALLGAKRIIQEFERLQKNQKREDRR